MRDGDHPFPHTALAIAYFPFESAYFLLNLFHHPRQHPRAIIQQPAIRGVVNVALYYRGVHSHLPPTDHSLLLRQGHDPAMQLEVPGEHSTSMDKKCSQVTQADRAGDR